MRDDSSATVRDWQAHSATCLRAAALLDNSMPDSPWPAIHLMALAVECALKAFICTARGGVPGARNLEHLLTLARHCGLRLPDTDRACILTLGVLRDQAPEESMAERPAVAEIERICRVIAPPTQG